MPDKVPSGLLTFDVVHKGDKLIDIDDRTYQAQLEQAEGTLDRDQGHTRRPMVEASVPF